MLLEAPDRTESRVTRARSRCRARRACGRNRIRENPTLVYNRALGEGISRDPIGEEGGVNLYAAMGNEPVNLIDALGLECTGHTCKPGEGDDDGLHFCGPPTAPIPRPGGEPGEVFNPPPPYNPADAGKPCCVDPATLKKAKRTDPPPTKGSKRPGGGINWTIHMALDLQIAGPYKDLQIYWTTCWRIDRTAGVIPTCSNKTACDFPTVTAGSIGGPYVTTARIFWLSCEGGKWTKKKHIAGGGYTFDGKWTFTGN